MSHSVRMSAKMVEARTKELAYALCRKYLGGEWAKVSFTNFHMEQIAGGLTNHLFLCSLPRDCKNKVSMNKVLLRLYGAFYSEMSENRFRMMEECLVCGLLAEKNMGPALYGIFPEGRLEQYIPNVRSLTNTELREPRKSKQVAENIAAFHKLTLPLSKEPNWIWSTIQKFLDDVKKISFSEPAKIAKLEKIWKNFDLDSELKFLRVLVEKSNSPVVFCHNDVQQGNLLVKTSSTKENTVVHLIDFEYSCYNYRGFDIGNHFSEWMNDYSHPEYPYFKGSIDSYPSPSEKVHFVRSYLQSFDDKDVSDDEIEKVIVEADKLSLVSHFFWALWSVIQENKSTINFGYLDYALFRLECYEHFKCFVREEDLRNGALRNRIIGLKH